nr:restriction endonuclease subunit S [Gimesia panareensis]
MFYNFFLPDELTQLVKSNEKEQEKCSVQRGDVFLTRTSETMDDLGMSSVARKDYPNATFNGFTKRLRPKPESPAHPEFVAYFLRSPHFRNEMLAFSTMSTRASLNNDMISRLRIKLPPLPEQKVIAQILGSLDDKIELNRRMNATLEGLAQALFQSWFVDFDPVLDNALVAGNPIPDELTDRAAIRRQALDNGTANREAAQHFPATFQFTEELGWIPEGWEIQKAENIVQRHKVSKKFTKKNVSKEGDVPVFDQGSGLILGYSDAPADINSSKELPNFIFGDHTCITHISLKPFSVGPNVIPLSAEFYDAYWTFYAIKDLQDFQEYRRHWMEFKIKEVLVPSEKLAVQFGDHVREFYKSIELNSETSSTLTKLRDTLLPQLISGELRIPNAAKLVECSLL